ncbi:hypothetical protein FA13DRAFT_1804733 [Coprinellus micaceus]|uniref:Uncharacterized protein n=1 Tax=Coprinellus micaceus TaxID=71717 RepID=A0A4Y7S593_COPMI|nr:hypothetical protein FA13DRAFT_1804733 [Coprinellus micaceus]
MPNHEIIYSEDRLLTLSKEDATMWDIKTAHLVPRVRSKDTIDWRRSVFSAPRHFNYTESSGYTTHFNVLQSEHTALTGKQRPYLGESPPTTRDEEIYQGFYPVDANWHGSLFRRVSISNISLRAAIHGPTSDGLYRLDHSISESWNLLEHAVVSIVRQLMPYLSLPYSLRLPPYPSSYRHSERLPSFDAAYEAARRSRNAFHELAALLSFVCCFWSKPGSTRPMHLLARYLSRALGLDFEWVATLLSVAPVHPIAAPQVLRRGMDMCIKSPWIEYLPLFIDSNIPIVVHLGMPGLSIAEISENRTAWEVVGPFLKDATQYAEAGHCCSQCEYQRQHLREAAFALTDPETFATTREAEWLEHCEALGLPEDKLIGGYDARGSTAYSTLAKFAMHEWVGEPGNYRRTPVDPCHFFLMVGAYSIDSRYVSLLHSEIDFFKDISKPAATALVGETEVSHLAYKPTVADSDITAASDTPVLLSLSCARETSGAEPQSTSDAADPYHSDEEDECGESTRPLSIPAPPLSAVTANWQSVLKVRCGYPSEGTCNLAPPPPNAHHSKFPDDESGINRALRVLGLNIDAHRPNMSRANILSCLYAVQALYDHKAGLYDVSVQFDLSTGDVWHRLHQTFNVEEVINTYDKVDVHSKSKEVVKVTEYRYALGTYEKPMERQWFVIVVHASTLLEIARSGIAGVLQVGNYLTQKGIAFATANYYPSTTKPRPPNLAREGQGIIMHDEVFSAARYQAYEQRRDDILTGMAGGLALKEGASLQRRAKNGRVIGWVKGGKVIISDRLEQKALDAILGRYLRFKNTTAQESVTLWPTSSNWDLMWINTNSWNEEAERWFNERVDGWHTGIADRNDNGFMGLKTSREWRSTSRGLTQVREVWNNYQRLAELYVRQRLPS